MNKCVEVAVRARRTELAHDGATPLVRKGLALMFSLRTLHSHEVPGELQRPIATLGKADGPFSPNGRHFGKP